MDAQFWNDYIKNKSVTLTSFPEDILKKYGRGKVLDLGCGDGTHANTVAKFGQTEVYGIDPSDDIIRLARSHYPQVHFQAGSAYELPYGDNFFDFVYLIDVIEHLKEPAKMLSEVRRVLKPGGIVAIQTPNYPIKRLYDLYNFVGKNHWRQSLKDDPTHFTKFTALGLKKLCAQFFTVMEFRTRNILAENKIKVLGKWKQQGNLFTILFGQKTIIILKNHK